MTAEHIVTVMDDAPAMAVVFWTAASPVLADLVFIYLN